MPFSWALVEDGRQRLLLRAPLDVPGPVRLLHGTQDADVPWATSMRLAEVIRERDVAVTLVKHGGHRLSEPPRALAARRDHREPALTSPPPPPEPGDPVRRAHRHACARDAHGQSRAPPRHAARRIVRRVVPSYRVWVTCRLEFRGRRRPVMAPNRYTELFFLDEAAVLAAGHRPCGECRRPDLRRFRTAWHHGNLERGVASDALTEAIDRELHRDRLAADRRPVTYPADLSALPDGVFVRGG